MLFELSGSRYSVAWIAFGAALTVTSAAGLLCLWQGWPMWPALPLVFVGVYGWTLWDNGQRLFNLYLAAQSGPPEAEPEAEAEPVDLARSEALDLLSRARAYNLTLPEAERDPRRLWPWVRLGISARRWSGVAHRLAETGCIRIDDDGTWATVGWTIPEIFAAVYSGEIALSPLPAGEAAGWGNGAVLERPEMARYGEG